MPRAGGSRSTRRSGAGGGVLILEGLFAWHEAQQQQCAFVSPSGEELFADLALIDTGWKHGSWNTQPVQVFCSQVGFGALMPPATWGLHQHAS